MLEHQVDQVEQGNPRDVSVFEDNYLTSSIFGGFTFEWSPEYSESPTFWTEVIAHENFDLFFEKYPKIK